MGECVQERVSWNKYTLMWKEHLAEDKMRRQRCALENYERSCFAMEDALGVKNFDFSICPAL